MPGRPRKPTAQKKMQGTSRKCREPQNEPDFSALASLPDAPTSFGAAALRLWNLGKELINQNVITLPDVLMFEEACIIYERYIKSRENLNSDFFKNIETKHGGLPAFVQQMNKDFLMLHKLLSDFGFTPAARSRLGIVKKKGIDPEAERMKELCGA
jgi:P27 family predicted phage terminase small subunit